MGFLTPTAGHGCLFNRIPVELLQEVFLHCLPPPPPTQSELIYHSLDLQGGSPRVAPLLLCQICSVWRRAALSLPSLWVSLDVFVSMGKARPSSPLCMTWLKRSGALSLSLSLHQQNGANENCVAAGEILEIYKEYIAQWGNIHLDMTGPSYCRLLTSQQKSAPMLREFRLQIQHQAHEEEKVLFGIFEFVPRLSKLYVSRIPDLNLFGDSNPPLPWSQLHSLSLDYVPSVATVIHVLGNCPKLADCTLKIDSTHGPFPSQRIHHQIQSLNINIGHEQLPALLEHVNLPGLTILVISVRGPLEQYGWPQEILERFFERSECRLLRFEIHDTGMRCHQFSACLRNTHLQSLVEFIVQDRCGWTWDPFVTDFAFELLTCPTFANRSAVGGGQLSNVGDERLTCVLPRLEILAFRGSCIWTKDGVIADMIESRWRFNFDGIRRLRRLEIEILSGNEEDFRRLKEFSKEGLELDLSFR